MRWLVVCVSVLWGAAASAGDYWLHHVEYIGDATMNRVLLMPDNCRPLRAFITSARIMQENRAGYSLTHADQVLWPELIPWVIFKKDSMVVAPDFWQMDEINRNMERYHAEILCAVQEGR